MLFNGLVFWGFRLGRLLCDIDIPSWVLAETTFYGFLRRLYDCENAQFRRHRVVDRKLAGTHHGTDVLSFDCHRYQTRRLEHKSKLPAAYSILVIENQNRFH